MKKLLTSIVALTMLFALTAAPKKKKADAPAKPAGSITMTWNNLWAYPILEVQPDWVSVEYVFDEEPAEDKLQFCVVSDKIEKVESWGNAYFCVYPKVEKTSVLVIDDLLNLKNDKDKTLIDNGATKITMIGVQSKVSNKHSLRALSIKVTKKDGSVENVVPKKDWGSTVKVN